MSSGDDLILMTSWDRVGSDLSGNNVFDGLTFVWHSG